MSRFFGPSGLGMTEPELVEELLERSGKPYIILHSDCGITEILDTIQLAKEMSPETILYIEDIDRINPDEMEELRVLFNRK